MWKIIIFGFMFWKYWMYFALFLIVGKMDPISYGSTSGGRYNWELGYQMEFHCRSDRSRYQYKKIIWFLAISLQLWATTEMVEYLDETDPWIAFPNFWIGIWENKFIGTLHSDIIRWWNRSIRWFSGPTATHVATRVQGRFGWLSMRISYFHFAMDHCDWSSKQLHLYYDWIRIGFRLDSGINSFSIYIWWHFYMDHEGTW